VKAKFYAFLCCVLLNSVFLTQQDMSDQYTIQTKLDSIRLWISNTKDFLPPLLKDMCDEYDRRVDPKMVPPKVRWSVFLWEIKTKVRLGNDLFK